MAQMILFLTEEEDEKILTLKKKWNMQSKHETIKKIINDFQNKK